MGQRIVSTVPWRKYLDSTKNPRVKKFLKNRGDDVLWQVSQGIHKGSRDSNNVKSELVMVVHPNAPAAILIPYSDYQDVLELALEFFEKKEEYEKCQQIVKFKNDIKPLNLSKENKLTKNLI